MISLKKADYEKILAHAKSCVPEEACGLIAGTKEGEDKVVEKVYLLTNIDHSNEHFTLDPKEQLAAVKDMRANGKASYMILSLMEPEQPVLNSFHIEGDESTKEDLVIC